MSSETFTQEIKQNEIKKDEEKQINYKIKIDDRSYTKYSYLNALLLKEVTDMPYDISPIKYKLFNYDIINYFPESNTVNLLHSSVRSMPTIPGVLMLESNKRYGKLKQKYLYKCIPDDRRLPEFLVPYNYKSGFNKKKNNKYIVFKFREWNSKHPIGTIVQVIGDVEDLTCFYEYQLYCKSLYASIQDFNKKTLRALRVKSQDEYIDQINKTYNIENRLHMDVITIDSKNSTDFDDALGVTYIEDKIILSVYISNVSFWLDTLNLWDSFSKRIATIYLPDRKRPMLPTILSEGLCSLIENTVRYVLTLDVYIDKKTYEIIDVKFCNSSIKVRKNMRYNDKELCKDKLYSELFNVCSNLNRKNKYVENISTAHDVIAYAMILMNYYSAKVFHKNKSGIFRTAKIGRTVNYPENLSGDVKKFLKIWNSGGGCYCKFDKFESHDILEFDAYVHVTSPIRRLVDLLMLINISRIDDSLTTLSANAYDFYDRWTSDESIDYINQTMISIRKVQNDASLLKVCIENCENLNNVYNGIIFDKIVRNDALYQYMVYIPSMKLVNRITTRHDKELFNEYEFKMYIFLDETRMKKKIRLEIM